MSAPELQLEKLVTRIMADASDFIAGTNEVIKRIVEVNQAFDNISTHTKFAAAAINKFVEGLVVALDNAWVGTEAATKAINTALSSIGLIPTIGITNFVSAMDAAVLEVDAAVGLISGSFKLLLLDVGAVTQTFVGLDLAISKLGAKHLTTLSNLGTAISGATGTLSPGVSGVANLQNLVNNLRSLASFGGVRFSRQMASLGNSLSGLVPTLARVASVDLSALSGTVSILQNLIAVGQGQASLGRLGVGLGRLAYGLNTIAALNMTTVMANGKALVSWLNMFAGINPTALTNINMVGKAISRLSAAGGGGALPPITNNFVKTTNAAGPAADRAAASVGRFGNSLNSLTSPLSYAVPGIRALNLGFMALAGLGALAFAKFDDSLVRTMAHMRDWDQISRTTLTQGVQSVASTSITSPTDLAKGLDVLASSGMNAAMSAEALKIAESFAVAGHMQMEDATKKLVGIQRTLGLEMENPIDHFREMTRLSDLFIGIAPLVGSSTKEMMDAMGPRFVAAMKMTKMSLEDGIGILGAYSIQNIRGSHASDQAARAIYELGLRAEESAGRFAIFGAEVFNKKGEIQLIPALEAMEKRFKGLTPEQTIANLSLLGFAQRAAFAIQPLIGMSGALKQLREDMKQVGGITELTAYMVRHSFMGQIKTAYNNVLLFATAIGSVLAPAIGFLAERLGELTTWFISLNPAVQALIVGFIAYTSIIRLALMPTLRFVAALAMFPVMMVVRAFTLVGDAIFGALSALWSFTKFAASSVGAAFSGLGWIFNLPMKIASMITSAAVSVAKSINSMFWSVIAGIVPFLVNLAFIIPTLLVIGSAFTAFAVTVGHIFVGIGVGIKSLWDSMKSGAGDAAVAVAEKFNDIANAGVSMWERIKESSIWSKLGEGLDKLAGFFWNFQKNIGVIIDWVGKNWQQMWFDVGQGFVKVVENIAKNIKELLSFIGKVGYDVWSGFYSVATQYTFVFSTFFKSQWKNMLADVWSMTSAFLQSLLYNFGEVVGKIDKVWSTLLIIRGEEKFTDKVIAGLEEKIKELKAFEGVQGVEDRIKRIEGNIEKLRSTMVARKSKDIESLFKDITSGFKGAEEFMPKKFKTDTSGLTEGLGFANKKAGNIPSILFENMGVFWKNLKLTSPFEGVKGEAPWGDLVKGLDFSKPADMIEQVAARVRKLYQQATGASEEAGMQPGKQGPGFVFKQISSARYMTGGAAAESLDYQQLIILKKMNDHLGNVANAANRTANNTEGLNKSVSKEPVLSPEDFWNPQMSQAILE